MLNPCFNPELVSIVSTVPDEKRYVILSASEADPYTFTHDAMTIETSPVTHTLCGHLTSTASFDGQLLSTASQPMAYDQPSGTFSIYSEDEGLIGLKTITIDAHLINYDTITASF